MERILKQEWIRSQQQIGAERGRGPKRVRDARSRADLRSVVAGTVTGDNVVAVAKVRVGPIAEMILPECAAANARLGITRVETERMGRSEVYTGLE